MANKIKPEAIFQGPFWPEKVREISVKPIGETQLKIEAVGLETQRFSKPFSPLPFHYNLAQN